MSKGPEKASSLSCSWHNSPPLIVDQLYKPEEMRKTIAPFSEPVTPCAQDASLFQGFILPSASNCAGPSHLGVCQGSGPQFWMSPELAQPCSAAGRMHSHWGNGIEQTATCTKPISILCINMARWIVIFFSLRSDLLPNSVFTSNLSVTWLSFISCVGASRYARNIPTLQRRWE